MLRANFSIYDLMVNGFKKTFGHIVLFLLTALTSFGLLIAALFGMIIIISPTLFKIWHMLPSIKAVMTALEMQSGLGIIKGGFGVVQGGMRMFGGLIPGASKMMSSSMPNANMVAQFIQKIKASLTAFDYTLFVIAHIFLIAVVLGLVLGFMRIVLDVVDTGSSTVSRILSCFHMVFRFFVASIMGIIVICFGLILFIIPGIILMLRLRFFPYYIIDKNMGALDSLKESYRATKGLVWDLLGLNIVAAVIVSLIPFFGIPVACFMLAGAYRVLPQH